MEDPAPEIITFARRKKKTDRVAEQKANVTPKSKSQSLPTPEQIQEGKAALQTPTEVVEDTIPARWRRNRGPMNAKQRQEAEQQAYIADMKALFAEIDALELAVETPTPPGKIVARQQRGGGWHTSDKPRAMSLGLSRRSAMAIPRLSVLSTTSKASPSPLRISSMGPRASLHTLPEIPEFNLDNETATFSRRRTGSSIISSSTAATAAGNMDSRRSSVMTAGESRRSSAARMFNSLSLRISDALGKMSRRSSLPGFGEEPEQQGLHAVEEGEEEEEVEETSVSTKAPGIFTVEEEKTTSSTPSITAKSITASAGTILAKELEARLTIDGEKEIESSPQFSELAPLEQLLRLCGQEAELESLPSMDELLGRHVDLSKVKKIGEGTFGEAFKAGNLVLKIVPMEGSLLVNGEAQKRAEEILAEVAITLTLSGLRESSNYTTDTVSILSTEMKPNATSGFVETHGVGICRGHYASALCKEWHRWDKQNKSENDSVDIFGADQLFVVFVVADGGLDLEHFEPRSFEELQSILMQVTMTLAVAEEACEFEHRDLHWGNLLISRDGTESIPYRLRDVDINVESAGVRVTLIDFTLSRLVTPEGEVAFCDLAADPELFNGPKGDAQAETYRKMQKATKNYWQDYAPVTNAFWLRYLADIILANKLPAVCNDEDKVSLRNFRKAASVSDEAGDLVWHDLFAGKWTSDGSSKSKA